MHISRDIYIKLNSLLNTYDCILLTGSRQVGKSTFLIYQFDDFEYSTLDNQGVYLALNRILLKEL